MTLKLGDYCVQSYRLAKYCFDPPIKYGHSKAEGVTISYQENDEHEIEPGIRKWSLMGVLDNAGFYDGAYKITRFSDLLEYINTTIQDTDLIYPAQKKFIAEALEWGLRTL